STPALKWTRTLRPQAHITLAVAEKAYELAKDCPFVNEVVAFPTAGGRSFPTSRDLPRWASHMLRLRGRFDVTINLYAVASSRGAWWIRFLLLWSGAALTIVSDRDGMAPFYSRSLKPPEIPADQLESSLAIVSLLDPGRSKAVDKQPELWISRETLMDVEQW